MFSFLPLYSNVCSTSEYNRHRSFHHAISFQKSNPHSRRNTKCRLFLFWIVTTRLHRQVTVAGSLPAALAVHLCIGQAYALSVFSLPLSKLIGIKEYVPGQDWDLTTTVWIFNIAFVFLGLSAALFGKWLERVGPRKAMFVSALCFCGEFMISALGVYLHIIWLLYLGSGVLGGIGLGLGYISPVSTLIK